MKTAQFPVAENTQTSVGSYTVGPPLPSGATKPPWRPNIAGRIAFFFGPLAGALIVITSLRRMGHSQGARKVMLLAVVATIVESALLLYIPDAFGRIVGFAAEVLFYLFFPPLMTKEFNDWQAAHPEIASASGWRAIGLGIIGIALFIVIFIVVTIAVSMAFPTHT